MNSTPSNSLQIGQCEVNPNFEFDKYGIGAKEIGEDAQQLITQAENKQSKFGMFECLPAADVVQQALSMPDPVQLYPILILEGEFSVLFADTGVGKTAFAMQIAIHIARNGNAVLFLDLELSKKQFQKRYTNNNGAVYKLPDNLYRADFARLNKVPGTISYEDYFFDSLIQLIEQTGAKVIFLDNLTKLAAGDTDTAKAAIPILERLNQLKADYKLTIIVLEHNKKVDSSRPIQLNDLQGSKMKSNLVDAVFTIGRSHHDKAMRYIKQVKVRDGEVVYDTENVMVCELSKESGYLSFTEKGFANEMELLKTTDTDNKVELIEKVKQLHSTGRSVRDIASELGLSKSKVDRLLKM